MTSKILNHLKYPGLPGPMTLVSFIII